MQNISTSNLFPHPDNPRKDLGDLTELAESIKANGILQNLTVVPRTGEVSGQPTEDYTVIIGHRRLAAAKLAGLEEVPCVISDMSEVQQIRTMLSENMQRADLTVYEQAQGFQMMLDMGDSVEEIAERAGFSQSTVRRRVKLLDLDKDKFKASAERGATLEDYVKLDQVEDPKEKNKLLDSIGTSNFAFDLRNAIDREQKKKNIEAWKTFLSSFATEVDSDKGYRRVRYIWPRGEIDIEAPDDTDTVSYYYYVSNDTYPSIYLLRDFDEEEERAQEEQIERERAEEEMNERVREINETTYELRYNFVKEYPGLKKHIPVLMECAVRVNLDRWGRIDEEEYFELLGVKPGENEDGEALYDYELLKDVPLERQLCATTYLRMEDSGRRSYFNWVHQFKSDASLNFIYEMLQRLGYQMSDEEKALQDGTHELFIKDDEAGEE